MYSVTVALHTELVLGQPLGDGLPGVLSVADNALHVEFVGGSPGVLPFGTLYAPQFRVVRLGLSVGYQKGVLVLRQLDGSVMYLVVGDYGEVDAARLAHQFVVDRWQRFHQARAHCPPLTRLAATSIPEVHARIGHYLARAGLAGTAVQNGSGVLGQSYHFTAASLACHIYLRPTPRGAVVEVIVPAVAGIDPAVLTPGSVLRLARSDRSSTALIHLMPNGSRWDLVAVSTAQISPLHLVDLDFAVKSAVRRAMWATLMVSGDGGDQEVPPVRAEGDQILPGTAESTFHRLKATVELFGGTPSGHPWSPHLPGFTVGDFVVGLLPDPVPVLQIQLVLGALDAGVFDALGAWELLAAGGCAVVGDPGDVALVRVAHVVVCETAGSNIESAMVMLAETGQVPARLQRLLC